MLDQQFTAVLEHATEGGLDGVALVDKGGHAIAVAGSIDKDEAMPLAALVMYRLKAEDLARRLFSGEILSLSLEGREIAVGVAKRQLFVVAKLAAPTPGTQERMRELCDRIGAMLADADPLNPMVWSGGGGGSDSGPSEMQLIELGITVPRAKA